MELTIPEGSGIKFVCFAGCKILTVGGVSSLITSISLKRLWANGGGDPPNSATMNLLSEVARRTKELPAGSFQLEELGVDSISAVLVAPVCSHLAATLHELNIRHEHRMKGLTEEEEKALQLLTSLQTLRFQYCPFLPCLPQGLHTLSSLRVLQVVLCPKIRSLPMGGLPTSLQNIWVTDCSAELHEQVKKLEGMNPGLSVSSDESSIEEAQLRRNWYPVEPM